MSETKWTPGPWHVEEESDEHEIYSLEIYAGPRLVASVRPAGDAAPGNANLIAAGPDLYEALRRLACVDLLSMENLAAAHAAMAKARGETP